MSTLPVGDPRPRREPPGGATPLVVLVAPSDSYRLGAFRRAAGALGASVVVVTDRPHPLDGAARHGAFTAPGTSPTGAADGDVLAGLRPDAVIATDAEATVFAAAAGSAAGLRSNPPDAAVAAGDKGLQRLAARRAGVRQPDFVLVEGDDDLAPAALAVGLPAVVKPLRLTAGRGVIRVEDPLDARAVAPLVRELGGHDTVLVERFVPGGEVALEGLLDDGRLYALAVYDKPDAPQGPTFPETTLITPSLLPAATQRRLVADTAAICAEIGLRHGPVHAEFRIDDHGRSWFLELAARTIGGRCASMLRFRGPDGDADRTLEELVLRQALGLEFDHEPADAAAGVWMIPIVRSGRLVAIEGADEVAALPAVSEVALDVVPGERLEALPRGGRYPGFVFARGDDPAEVHTALAKAAATLRLVIEPER